MVGVPKYHRHYATCSCIGSCSIAALIEWEGDANNSNEWFVEFYEVIRPQARWKDRFRVAWAVLRGREPYTHGLVLQEEEIIALRDFLNKRTNV